MDKLPLVQKVKNYSFEFMILMRTNFQKILTTNILKIIH